MIDILREILHETKIEEVKYIVPERIREALAYRGMTSEEGRIACKFEDKRKWDLYCMGCEEIPKEFIFNLVNGLHLPKEFFYQVKWYRG